MKNKRTVFLRRTRQWFVCVFIQIIAVSSSPLRTGASAEFNEIRISTEISLIRFRQHPACVYVGVLTTCKELSKLQWKFLKARFATISS